MFGKKFGFNKNKKSFDVCHGIVDAFITRQFCLQVSWSGQARAANVTQKLNFSANKKLLEAFFNVVYLASTDATDVGIQTFFSGTVFRNATARLSHKKYKNYAGAPPTKRKRSTTTAQSATANTAEHAEAADAASVGAVETGPFDAADDGKEAENNDILMYNDDNILLTE